MTWFAGCRGVVRCRRTCSSARRWVVSITGVAAELHHARRSHEVRHPARVGVDLGVKTLAVVADEHGAVLAVHEGVKALQHAQTRLKLANQSYSRTKRGSAGRKKAARRLGRVHARVAHLRKNLLHELTSSIVKGYAAVVVEDLNAAGMLANRKLARVVSDASFGELRRQVEYKAVWYGTELVVATGGSPRPRRARAAAASRRTSRSRIGCTSVVRAVSLWTGTSTRP